MLLLPVGETPILENEIHLARNLDRHFPSLQAVYDVVVGWVATRELLGQGFQAVRTERAPLWHP